MELLIKQYRGDVLENVHIGAYCIVNKNEKVIDSLGDVNMDTIYRSCSKPLQLLPLILNGGKEKYDLTEPEITVMCASHTAEDIHIETIEALMQKVGLLEDELYCPPILPGYLRKASLTETKPMKARRIYYNCSGKHVGLMLGSKVIGANYSKYYQVDHPVQKEIIEIIKDFSSYDKEVQIGIDGCGVPVYTVDLKGCAIAFMKLANPEVLKDEKLVNAVKTIVNSINNYSAYLCGKNSLDEVVNSDKNLIGKIGAQGLYTVGLKKEGLGIAIKMMDGTGANRPFILAKLLEKLNYENKETIKKLYQLRGEYVYNHAKEVVGKRIATF